MKTLAQLIYEKNKMDNERLLRNVRDQKYGWLKRWMLKQRERENTRKRREIEWRAAKNVRVGDGTCAGRGIYFLNKSKKAS